MMRLQSCRFGVAGYFVLLALGASGLLAQPIYPARYGVSQGYPQAQANGQQAYAQEGYGQPGAYGQGYRQQSFGGPQQGNSQPTEPSMNAEQLEQLVAPIALYPDTLVAQMLAAATYPAQVEEADRWLEARGNASPYEIAGGADTQNWDPSVKGLTAFPQVLAEMDRNPGWMTDLGNAYYNQPQDVLEAVQMMRQRAQAAGTLSSTPEENVSYNAGAIELAPPNPQMVYVPQYNPWAVYGDPITAYPGFSLASALGSFFSSGAGSPALSYGLGIAMAAFNHTPFGWLSWGLSWVSNAVLFNNADYSTRSASVADWGVRGGGMRAFGGGGVRDAAERGDGREPWRFAPVERRDRVGQGYGRAQVEAFNRVPAPIVRAQRYSRPETRLAYGPNYYNGGGAGLEGRGYGGVQQTYRSQPMQAYGGGSEGYGRGGFGGLASFNGEKAPRSGGFHLFGGGEKESSFREPKFKEPKFKEPKMPKMASGGHSSGGGHSGGGWFSGHGGRHHG